MSAGSNDIECPFCHLKEFDLVGLKEHFEFGWCEIYIKIPYQHLGIRPIKGGE